MMKLAQDSTTASRILALGVLLSALMTALMLVARPSYASTTATE